MTLSAFAALPLTPLNRPFGPPTGVEPRVSTRPSDPRRGEEGASPLPGFHDGRFERSGASPDTPSPHGEKVARRVG
ncbi:hypothetical protein CO652_22555 [Rhizobium sp. H4]|nr:hypothetical protein CO652_22555 [Rhizobium sp. H4]